MISHDLIPVQLGRFWSFEVDRVFCEPDASTPANIYACPLPPARMRLTPACSLTIPGSPQTDPQRPLWTVEVDIVCVALTEAEAFAMAAEAAGVFFPGGRTAPLFEAGRDTVGGLVGVPENAAAGDVVWRFIAVTRLSSPGVLFGTGINGTNTEGHAAVGFTIEVLAVEHTLTAEEV